MAQFTKRKSKVSGLFDRLFGEIARVFGRVDAGLIPGSGGEPSTRPNHRLPMASRTRRSRHPCERSLPEDFRGSVRDPVRLLHQRGGVWAC
jgi:hypothetical protein